LLKKILFSIPLLPLLINAQTLTDITDEIIRTNPEIQEKRYYYNSVKEEYNFVKSGYLPTIDLSVSFGQEYTKKTNLTKDIDLFKSESSLILVQNLFEGFKTENEIEEKKAKFMSASFDILEKTNSIALDVAQKYINILKYKEMVLLAKESIATHKKILMQIKEKVDAGFSPRSDMLQIQTRYTLAKADLITQKNSLENELIKFHKILGRFMNKKEFVLPQNSFEIPENIDKATSLALEVHPAIKVSNYNVEMRKSLYEQEKNGYYPSVDLILKADKNKNSSAIEGTTDRYYAGIQLKYNLFSGFADEASIQKNISRVHEENSLRDKIRRQIIESVRLAWRSYNSLLEKEKILKEHVSFADQARKAYLEEFLIAKRTLLDILNIEGEYNSAKKSKTDNYYKMLYTEYELMDAMGILSEQLGLTDSKYRKSINSPTQKDILPLDLEKDKDKVIDMSDICDTTIDTMNVNRYGCVDIIQEKEDEVVEEVIEIKPIEKVEDIYIPKPIEVKKQVIPIVKKKLQKKIKPKIENNDKEKRNLEKEVIYFEYKSSVITEKSVNILDRIVAIMQKEPTLKLELSAYTDSLASKKYNKKLSLNRAIIVKNHLMEEGILSSRIKIYGRGEDSPIASNDTKEGRAKNRRVEILFIEDKKDPDEDIELAPIDFDIEEVDRKDMSVEEEEVEEEYDPENVELEQIEIDF